jgi:hypothetical protein
MSDDLDVRVGRGDQGDLHGVGGRLDRCLLRDVSRRARGRGRGPLCLAAGRLRLGPLPLSGPLDAPDGTGDEVLEALRARGDVQVGDGARLEVVDPAVDEDGLERGALLGALCLFLALGSQTVVQLTSTCSLSIIHLRVYIEKGTATHVRNDAALGQPPHAKLDVLLYKRAEAGVLDIRLGNAATVTLNG